MSTKKTTKAVKASKAKVSKVSKAVKSNATNVKKNKKSDKNSAKKEDVAERPSLESILEKADHAFTDIVKRYLTLGEAYVKALTFYGSEGKRAFKTRFPLTDNALRNLEYVGRGRLLPQFAMCSDRFVKGLVDMVDSLTWQYKLLGASQNGMIRVRINGNIVDAKFTDLRSEKMVDGVLSIISDENKDLTPQQLCEKLKTLRGEVRSKFTKESRPFFTIVPVGNKKFVRFFRSKALSADDLRKIIEKLES